MHWSPSCASVGLKSLVLDPHENVRQTNSVFTGTSRLQRYFKNERLFSLSRNELTIMWKDLTFLWNDLTILWNDLTFLWNDLSWNDLTRYLYM